MDEVDSVSISRPSKSKTMACTASACAAYTRLFLREAVTGTYLARGATGPPILHIRNRYGVAATRHGGQPLLFLDVDGTLLPRGEPALREKIENWTAWQSPSNPHLSKIDPAHGERLRALPCDLIWATAWMHDANKVIAPLLGLPQLPVADLPDAPDEDPVGVLHWKTKTLVATAAGRPFAWLDDELTDLDRAWVAAHHPGRALLHQVDTAVGLTSTDVTIVEDWLRDLPGRPRRGTHRSGQASTRRD